MPGNSADRLRRRPVARATQGRCGAVRAFAVLRCARRVQRHQLRQRVGNLHAREVLVPAAVADQHRQVQAEVGDVRERPARIERQRRQNREIRFPESTATCCAIATRSGRRSRASTMPCRSSASCNDTMHLCASLRSFFTSRADGHQLRPGAHAVEARVQGAGVHLRHQSRHPDHEELVQVRAENRQETSPAPAAGLALVLRLLQHAALKRQHREFAIEE